MYFKLVFYHRGLLTGRDVPSKRISSLGIIHAASIRSHGQGSSDDLLQMIAPGDRVLTGVQRLVLNGEA
jgi:hypothetical protein